MKSNFTNQLFFTSFVFVLLLSDLRRCAWGLGRAAEERHRLKERLPRTHDSSAPPTERHLPGTEPVDPALPPYLQLPVFLDSRIPLVDPEHFRPSEGTGDDPLPEPMLELLRPGSTEPPPTEPQPEASVRIDCKHNRMFVEVDRAVLGSSDPKRTLRLGNCSSTKTTEDYVYFELKLTKCGTDQTIEQDQVVFYNTLHYKPEETQSVIRRAAPFTLDLSCHFNRFQYSYKMAFVPKSHVQNLFKRMRYREKFKLTPKNARWEPLTASDTFALGRPMFFEAHTELLSSGKRLYVHSCFATPEPSASSTPRFNVVSNYGCMVESKDGRSSFIPSVNNAVRFSVDAFIFAGLHGNTLYMHCTMSVGPYAPTDTDKSCNYRSEIGRWVELNGSDSVCSCCDFICDSPVSPETVISSKAWNIDVKPTAAAERPEINEAKRKSKSLRMFRPELEDPGQNWASESALKDVRWAVAEAEPLEVAGSAEVEEVEEVEEEVEEPEKGKRLFFEEIFGLNLYDPPHNKIKG